MLKSQVPNFYSKMSLGFTFPENSSSLLSTCMCLDVFHVVKALRRGYVISMQILLLLAIIELRLETLLHNPRLKYTTF